MSHMRTVTLTKDGVEYELDVEITGNDIAIETVVALNALGVIRAEQEFDPEEFSNKLMLHEWEAIREQVS